MRSVRTMSDDEIRQELDQIGKDFVASRADPEFDGHCGSPGEWMYERIGELETELRRRSVK